MPEMTALPIELTILAWSVPLLIAHVLIQGQLATRARGLTYNAGPRDEEKPPLPPHAARAARALENFKETYPAFVAAVLVAALSGRTGTLSAVGVWLWLLARLAYLPLYVFGVPLIRSAVWGVSVLGILLVLLDLI